MTRTSETKKIYKNRILRVIQVVIAVGLLTKPSKSASCGQNCLKCVNGKCYLCFRSQIIYFECVATTNNGSGLLQPTTPPELPNLKKGGDGCIIESQSSCYLCKPGTARSGAIQTKDCDKSPNSEIENCVDLVRFNNKTVCRLCQNGTYPSAGMDSCLNLTTHPNQVFARKMANCLYVGFSNLNTTTSVPGCFRCQPGYVVLSYDTIEYSSKRIEVGDCVAMDDTKKKQGVLQFVNFTRLAGCMRLNNYDPTLCSFCDPWLGYYMRDSLGRTCEKFQDPNPPPPAAPEGLVEEVSGEGGKDGGIELRMEGGGLAGEKQVDNAGLNGDL